MRVLIVAPSFGAYGGMEAFVLSLTESLTRDPRLEIRACFKQVQTFTPDRAMVTAAAGLPVEFVRKASRELWSAIAWADVVHAQNASPDVALMAAAMRKPVALSLHNVLPARPRLRRRSWQMSARLAAVRWYNSRFVWDTWEPHDHQEGSACVFPSSSNLQASVPVGERRGFVFLGRLVPGKGVDVLLNAYHRAGLDPSAWPLSIAGEGPMRAELETQAAKLGLTGVRFHGFVTGSDKARLIASASWLVAPSHWQEPFGLVAHEARSLAVPCIATRDGGLPEAAGIHAVLCEPRDVDGLAAALRSAVAMGDREYQTRCERTQRDLNAETTPMSFYAEAYLNLHRKTASQHSISAIGS